MTDYIEQPTEKQNTSKSLQQLIERLKPLHVMLAQNTYVKDTTKRLKRIIEDAQEQSTILFIGKERVGKTTIINALLGRELLSVSKTNPTRVNTFIKYGEKECVKAIFLDGMIATFDISKIELLTTSDAFSSQIIREHLDYIEIFIQHDLLKSITLVDSVALEIGGKNTAYLSELLLERVDEIMWVLSNGSVATEPEINYLMKLHNRGIQPHVIVNAIDRFPGSALDFMKQEQAKYGDKCLSMLGISALQAIEAKKTNSVQLSIDSQFTQFIQLMQQLSNNHEKKIKRTIARLVDWLNRLRNEVEGIPMREPFLSAVQMLEQYTDDSSYELSLQQRDQAIVSAYEEQYEQVSKVFKSVQTLYQLLQLLATDIYLRDEKVERFEERAVRYQKAVLDYRKLHAEYTQQYNRLDKQHVKSNGQNVKSGFKKTQEQSEHFTERISHINHLQLQCSELFSRIKQYEKEVVDDLYEIQNHLTALAEKRLNNIIEQIHDLNNQRKREQTNLTSYINKLNEFLCIIEAQTFIQDGLKPFLLNVALPITEKQQSQIIRMIERICAVDLLQAVSKAQLTAKADQYIYNQKDFQALYHLQVLRLTEADVVSDIPAVPAFIE